MNEIEKAKAILKENNIRQVFCAFSDVRGYLMTFSIPAREFIDGNAFEGIGFDGSSIRGFKSIDQSDMLWVPDPKTLRVIPWINDAIQRSAIMFGDVYEAWATGVAECDPRGYVAKRVEKELESQGMTAIFGPEIEFFVFKGVDFRNLVWDLWTSPNGGAGDSWGAPRILPFSDELSNGYIIRPKEGYFRAPPEDTTVEYRNELVYNLEQLGVMVEYHHHEVATPGQIELDFRPKQLTAVGDAFYLYKLSA
ncbi:MAG: glutamine synthetase beta-grasp domain-containing protein, partial [Archaeoglobaceae archaeon]